MAAGTWPGDLHVAGHLSSQSATVATGSVRDASVASDAAIAASKLAHQHRVPYAQPNTAATSETRFIHHARGTGTLIKFSAGSIAKAVGDSTVTVDLRKGGVSILSAPITLDNANTNRVAEDGTVTDTAVAAGNVFEVVIVATIGTGTLPTGVFASLDLSEAYAA